MTNRTSIVDQRGLQALGPVPQHILMSVSAGARAALLSAGARGGSQEEVAAGSPAAATALTVQPDRDWYRITNTAGGPAVVDIFDEIGYWGVVASEFQRELNAITATEITLNLNSPGGEIFEGIAIYNALRSHPAAVTVRVSSLAASIASVIAQAGDTIIMQPGAQMMIHEASGLEWGNAAALRKMADLLDKQSDNIASVYAERAGGTPEDWRARMQTETWYTAEEAVAAGLADEVDAPARQGKEQPEPASARWDLSIFNFAGRTAAPAPVLNTTAPADTELATGGVVASEALIVVGEGPVCDWPAPPAAPTPEPAAAEPTPEPEPVHEQAPDPWAALTSQLTATPSWDDVTASLREASK